MNTKHGSILKDREMRATACLLENIHQHVKKGIGLCVIKIILGKYKRISVSDNGEGFYNYKKQKQLSVKDAIKFGLRQPIQIHGSGTGHIIWPVV